jgi:hypothetical protein
MAESTPVSKRELQQSILFIALVVAVIVLSALLLVTSYWFVWPIIVAGVLVGVGYFSASKHPYQCPSCSEPFTISALQDFFAPHGITKGPNGEVYEWKLLKCPNCSKRAKCYRTGQKK